MRTVLDTNTVISGLLWRGAPRLLLDQAREESIQLFTTLPLLVELQDVLQREKFSTRLQLVGLSPNDLVIGYASLATLVEPMEIKPVIAADPDDDTVLACALAARADVIVSGDSDLLNLGEYQAISILSANEALLRISSAG